MFRGDLLHLNLIRSGQPGLHSNTTRGWTPMHSDRAPIGLDTVRTAVPSQRGQELTSFYSSFKTHTEKL